MSWGFSPRDQARASVSGPMHAPAISSWPSTPSVSPAIASDSPRPLSNTSFASKRRLRRGDCGVEHLPQQRPAHGAPGSKVFISEPIPSIATSIVAPSLIEPTPTDVPHAITSPGNNDMSREILATNSSGGMIMSESG